ncbi:MAG: helicase-associated domain-containing protein [Thermoguttaceae bacterium]|jgi:hypothetical protein
MKIREIDWQDFFQRLEAWGRLSVPARRAFAKMVPSQPRPLLAFHGDHELLIESGFVSLERNAKKVRIHEDCRGFAALVRFMTDSNLLANPDQAALHRYLRYQFDRDEREDLLEGVGLNYWQDDDLERLAVSVGWLEKFLASGEKDLKPRKVRRHEEWGYRRMPAWLSFRRPDPAPKPVPKRPAVPLPTMKDVVRQFLAWPAAVPLKDLPARLPQLSPEMLAGAVAMGAERLLLFPGMRPEDMTPMVGLWPAVTRRLHRPKAQAPRPVQPETAFDGAFLMEDMTTVLVAASAQPIRLRRNDRKIFAKAEQELAAGLMVVPEWVGKACKLTPSERISTAAQWLREMKLLRRRSGSESPRLEAARRAPDWLAHSGKNRLKAILDHLRPQPSTSAAKAGRAANDDDYYDDEESHSDFYEPNPQVSFLPFRLSVSGGGNPNRELIDALAAAFGSVPEGQLWPLRDFVAWRSQEHNPLLKWLGQGGAHTISFGYSSQRPTAENLETLWARFLTEFLFRRLLPLGGARLATQAEDQVCFAPTAAGRYLLGLAGDFDYGLRNEPQRQVVVQPNFDVVFLTPSPLAEATLARIAQRQARGVGALFKITKKSILAAAGAGMTTQQTLGILTQVSSKPLPANVAREIQGWFEQCRRIRVEPTVIIRCPDADTAARVAALAGPSASLITQTIVELADVSAKTELVRKLHGVGIFVDRRHAGPQPGHSAPDISPIEVQGPHQPKGRQTSHDLVMTGASQNANARSPLPPGEG